MNLKKIRIMQIIGLTIGLILTCIGVILIIHARQQLLYGGVSGALTIPEEKLLNSINYVNALTALDESFASIIAGMILILITTIPLLLIKDNNQKNSNLYKKK